MAGGTSTDWKTGELAVATVRGVPNVRVMRTDAVWTGQPVDGWYTHRHGHVTDLRRLYVLDLEGTDPRRLAAALREAHFDSMAEQIEQQCPQPPADTVGIVCDDCRVELIRARVVGWGAHGSQLLQYSAAELQTAVREHNCSARPSAEEKR